MTRFKDMLEGYKRFKSGRYTEERARWEELSQGQSPRVMIIGCSDSRVEPAQIFDASPGEMFVVRNVANLVPPAEIGGGRHGVSAAIEFAVTQLKVDEIVVMGHGSCGGVKAALSQPFADAKPNEGGYIAAWIDLLDEPAERVRNEHGEGPDAAHALELEGIRTSIANLRTFGCVNDAEKSGQLKIHGAWFGIAGGQLKVMDNDSGEFAAA